MANFHHFRRYACSPYMCRKLIFVKIAKKIKFVIVLSKPLHNPPFKFFEILSLYSHQAMLNVKLSIYFLMRSWRKREKNPCVHGEDAKRIYAQIEKTQNIENNNH